MWGEVLPLGSVRISSMGSRRFQCCRSTGAAAAATPHGSRPHLVAQRAEDPAINAALDYIAARVVNASERRKSIVVECLRGRGHRVVG